MAKTMKNRDVLSAFSKRNINGVKDALGIICIVDLNGIEENFTLAQKKLEIAGLKAENLLERPKKSLFVQAIKSLETADIIFPVCKKGDCIQYQTNEKNIVQSSNSAWDEAKIKKVTSFRYFPEDEKIQADNQSEQAEVERIIEEEREKVHTPQISAAIRRCFKFDAPEITALSSMGNVFFAPCDRIDLLEKIQKFIQSVSGKNICALIPIGEDDSNKKTYWPGIKSEIENKFKELEETYNNIKTAMDNPDPNAKRPKTALANLLKKFQMDKQIISSFSDLFKMNSSEISERINSLESKLAQGFTVEQ